MVEILTRKRDVESPFRIWMDLDGPDKPAYSTVEIRGRLGASRERPGAVENFPSRRTVSIQHIVHSSNETSYQPWSAPTTNTIRGSILNVPPLYRAHPLNQSRRQKRCTPT